MLDKLQIMEGKNPKQYWNLVNSLKSNRSAGISDDISPSEWFSYFKDLNQSNVSMENRNVEDQIAKDFQIWAAANCDTLDSPITIEEIQELSKNLKTKKASARDSITNEVIKSSLSVLAPFYVKLFNIVLSSGIFSTRLV